MRVKGGGLAEIAEDAISPWCKPYIRISEDDKYFVVDNSSDDASSFRSF